MHVAISGAGGAVGNVVAPEFEEDQRTLFTHGDGEAPTIILSDTGNATV
jgi:hypothetical protein